MWVEVLGLEDYLDRWSRAHGGYDVRSSRPTRAWLRLAHRLGLPLARRGVRPTTVTAVGALGAVAIGAVASVGGRWPLLSVVLVVVVALLDGIDGAVAEMTDSATAWGRIADQLVDRLGDLSMITGLWLLGAPGPVCAAAAVLMMFDESTRSSAGAEGLAEVGLVTVAERPTRLVLAGLSFAVAGAVPSVAGPTATAGASVWALLALVSAVQLVVNVRRRLRGVPRNVARRDGEEEAPEPR
jgi:phosphatidylglycerophosphate synthase